MSDDAEDIDLDDLERRMDGAMAAQYLSTVKTLLENSATLLV